MVILGVDYLFFFRFFFGSNVVCKFGIVEGIFIVFKFEVGVWVG